MIETDLILYNANVLTFDPDLPPAELIVVHNGRVLHVSISPVSHIHLKRQSRDYVLCNEKKGGLNVKTSTQKRQETPR